MKLYLKNKTARAGVPSVYGYEGSPSESKRERVPVTASALSPLLPKEFRRDACFGREKEARDRTSEASADPSIFRAVSSALALPSQGGTSTSLPCTCRVQPLFLLFDFQNRPRLCRVLPGFEPAFAGGFRPGNFALAQAYRVISCEIGTPS